MVLGGGAEQSGTPKPKIEASCELLRRDTMQYAESGRLTEARARLIEGVLELEKTESGVECVGFVFNSVGDMLQSSGRLTAAESFAERSLSELETDHQPDDRILLQPLQILAAVYLRRGEVGRARDTLRRLQAVRTEWLGEAALVRGIKAALLHAEGRDVEAEQEYIAILASWEKAGFGNSHVSYEVLNSLASLYTPHARFFEARDAFQRAQAILESQPDTTESDRMTILNNLATLYYQRRDYPQAEEYFRRAIALEGHLPQEERGALKTILFNYALLLRKTDRKHEAKVVERRAKAIVASDENSAKSSVVDATELRMRSAR
jgi:tetratricopeptide (TPR) repeat protein